MSEKFREKKDINKKVFIDLIIYFCSIVLIVPMFNIIIYYSRGIQSSEANQMKICWPLLLMLSILIILHVYQISSFHRKTFLNKKILEIKSTPNYTKPSKYFIENRNNTLF
ncbi:unnamed protein product, partial [Rotaria sp. Silwood2]